MAWPQYGPPPAYGHHAWSPYGQPVYSHVPRSAPLPTSGRFAQPTMRSFDTRAQIPADYYTRPTGAHALRYVYPKTRSQERYGPGVIEIESVYDSDDPHYTTHYVSTSPSNLKRSSSHRTSARPTPIIVDEDIDYTATRSRARRASTGAAASVRGGGGRSSRQPVSSTKTFTKGSHRPSPTTKRPRSTKTASSPRATDHASRQAAALKARPVTDEDIERHDIPSGYLVHQWDPDEHPILLLGSVFDANSLGKYIFDWATYQFGRGARMSDVAGDLWLGMIRFAGSLRRAEEGLGGIRDPEHRHEVHDLIRSGRRNWRRLRTLLEACEQRMLKASDHDSRSVSGSSRPTTTTSVKTKIKRSLWGTRKTTTITTSRGQVRVAVKPTPSTPSTPTAANGQAPLSPKSGVALVECMFGRDQELARTRELMDKMRAWEKQYRSVWGERD